MGQPRLSQGAPQVPAQLRLEVGPALSPAGLPAAAATKAIMSHVSGRPSLAPGGLQACEMQQTRGTGSDSSAHALGAAPQVRAEPAPTSLRETTTSGSRGGGRGGPEDRPGPGPGLRMEGPQALWSGGVRIPRKETGPRRVGSGHSTSVGPLTPWEAGTWRSSGPCLSPESPPRPPGPHKPSVQRSTAQDAVLPSPPPAPP